MFGLTVPRTAGWWGDRIVTPHPHDGIMHTYAVKRHLDDVESYLRKAKRACDRGSELERYIKRALSALDDAQRLLR